MTATGLKRLYLGYLVLTLILSGVVGFAVGARLIDGALAMKGLMAFVGVSAIAGLPLAWIWWSKIDEAVREAHKWAWFWGGSWGLFFVLPFIAAFHLTDGAFYRQYLTFLHLRSGFGEFAAGILTTVLCMVTGYVIAWAWWWWKRR